MNLTVTHMVVLLKWSWPDTPAVEDREKLKHQLRSGVDLKIQVIFWSPNTLVVVIVLYYFDSFI